MLLNAQNLIKFGALVAEKNDFSFAMYLDRSSRAKASLKKTFAASGLCLVPQEQSLCVLSTFPFFNSASPVIPSQERLARYQSDTAFSAGQQRPLSFQGRKRKQGR